MQSLFVFDNPCFGLVQPRISLCDFPFDVFHCFLLSCLKSPISLRIRVRFAGSSPPPMLSLSWLAEGELTLASSCCCPFMFLSVTERISTLYLRRNPRPSTSYIQRKQILFIFSTSGQISTSFVESVFTTLPSCWRPGSHPSFFHIIS